MAVVAFNLNWPSANQSSQCWSIVNGVQNREDTLLMIYGDGSSTPVKSRISTKEVYQSSECAASNIGSLLGTSVDFNKILLRCSICPTLGTRTAVAWRGFPRDTFVFRTVTNAAWTFCQSSL